MSDRRVTWLAVVGFALLLLGGRGCNVPGIGSAPPFATDKLAVLVIHESTERGKLTNDQLNVLDATDATSVKAIVEGKGGQFWKLDVDTADNLQKSPPWVAAAFAVKRDSLPWVVGATPSSGFSVPLTTEADLRSRVEGLR